MGIAGLGALAGGLSSGIERGQRISGEAQRQRRQRTLDERNDVLWGRQQEQFGREDQERGLMEQANQAGAEVLKRYQDEWQKQQPGPTLDGAPVQATPFQPSPMQILEAGSARTNKLLELKGPTETWLNAWTNDERMRTQVRAAAGQKVKAALASGADPTQAITEFFGTISDGYKVAGVKPVRGADGKPVLAIERVNAYTGQPAEPMVVPADRLAQDIDMLAANPADLAKHSLNMTLKAYEAALDRGTAKEKHGYSLEEIDRRNRGDVEVARIRSGDARNTARTEAIRALAQERTSVDNKIRALVQQRKDTRPNDWPIIDQQLEEARRQSDDIRLRLADLSAPEGGARAPRDTGRTGGDALMDAATRDAKTRGLDEFTVESKLVNEGRPTTVRLKDKAAPKPGQAASGVARPTSKEEYDALPSGARYERDGKTYRKK